MNVISLLKTDHRKVERLFERYGKTSDVARKRKILDELTRELSVHMVAEERVLYPVVRTSIEDGPALAKEAVEEHDSAKALLAELADRAPDTFDADAKVATLRQAVDHHVKEEEREIFPEMAKVLGAQRLSQIGAQLERDKKSAPVRPSKATAAKSPGASILGMAEAATQRVTRIFQSEAPSRRPTKSSGAIRQTGRPSVKTAAKKRAVAKKRVATAKRKVAKRK
ncbi:MAG: hemerythrin domain-containing protein [Candidatus Binatia bacterium]